MLTIYGIKSCDTCRKALAYLKAHDIEHKFHDVRDDGMDMQMLERWARSVGWEKLLNKRSLTWRKVPEADRGGMTREKALRMILEQPTLMKRPVFEARRYTAVGFSEKRFSDFLDKLK
ncbi:MAG: Spx/MgsR family RNA polymerase-binding regulatory protein [Woeseiaceae bacterium]|nr:Spx/MgsR family RNA polymerase-binding regulatory protein [Woeseiaceae bacterium]